MDREILDAVNEAQKELAKHVDPSVDTDPEEVLSDLLGILDNTKLVEHVRHHNEAHILLEVFHRGPDTAETLAVDKATIEHYVWQQDFFCTYSNGEGHPIGDIGVKKYMRAAGANEEQIKLILEVIHQEE